MLFPTRDGEKTSPCPFQKETRRYVMIVENYHNTFEQSFKT